MATTLAYDPVLSRFHTALNEMYDERLERVVLYGSRARDGARPESDYDVAVFLRDMNDRPPELPSPRSDDHEPAHVEASRRKR